MSLLVLDQARAEQATQHDPVEPAEDSIVTWGPVSVEAVSTDDKLITMEAIEEALPQLYRRKTGSVLHKDQTVGDVHPLVQATPQDAPTPEAQALVDHLVDEHGGLPTDVFPVTEQIAQAFPHLEDHVGEPVFFAAMEIFGDSETSRLAQEEVQAGNLDSYSLSGAPVQDEVVQHCEADECRPVQRIDQMDLSAITLGSRTENASPLGARVRNPGAAFRLVQQADLTESCCDECEQAGSRVSQSSPSQGGPHEDNPTMTSDTDEDPDEAATAEQAAEEAEEGATEQADDELMEVVMELRNRLESLETDLAQLKGSATEAEDEEMDDEDDDEEEMEEAEPSTRSVSVNVDEIAEQAADKIADKLNLTKEEELEQASTPEPATPSEENESPMMELIEAADSGDPAELKLALRKHTRGGA